MWPPGYMSARLTGLGAKVSDLVHLGLEFLRTAGRLRGAEGGQREATARSALILYEPHLQANSSEVSAVITYLFAGEALGSLDFLRGDLDGARR